jgi:glycerol uptake facilitator-like aquaporin
MDLNPLRINFRNSLNLFFPKYCPKSGLLMMVGQVFGSAVGVSLLSFAQSSQPLQLNPAAAMMMPRHFKNSFSMKGRIFDPLSLLFVLCTTSFDLASLDFQFFEENTTINNIVVSIYIKRKKKQTRQTYFECEFEKQMCN